MTTAMQVDVTVSARAAAVAWTNCFLATSQEDDRPALYRTLSLEFFATGLHLIGCDGTALFRAWVPAADAERGSWYWPELDEAPERSVVVMDPDGFGIGFMKALLRVTNDEAHMLDTLQIATAPCDDEAVIPLGTEFMTERLTLRACGQRIDLRLYESPYPDWRRLKLGIDAERVDGMLVAPRLLAMLGKIKGASRVDLAFNGASRHIDFTATGEAEVRGVIMPMRRAGEE